MILLNIPDLLYGYRVNLLSILDPETLIRYGGILIILLAVFAQTGLFFCFFLPSGAFLVTGGLFVATGQLPYNLLTVCTYAVLASLAGCFTGYWFGRKTGPILYERKDSKFFQQAHLLAAKTFYIKYGRFALTVGLLFPVIRTFAPIVAGLVKMNISRFLVLSLIGSVLWVPAFIVAGYLLGVIPGIKEYAPYIMIAFLLVVTMPLVVRIAKEFKKAGKENGANN